MISHCTGRGWMCCPKGWKRFQESCYYLSDDKMGWAESKQNCTGMDSHLVVINSEAEQVCTALKRGTIGRDTEPGPRGDSEPLFACRGGRISFLHPFSTGSPLPPALPHGDSCCLPLLSSAPHGHCAFSRSSSSIG